MVVTTFEAISTDSIEVHEDGQRKTIIDTDLYGLYVHEVSSRGPSDIELIPHPYYQLIFNPSNPSVNDVSEERLRECWDNIVSHHLLESTATRLFDFQKRAVCKMFLSKKVLNATSMGCGKTVQALCALRACESISKVSCGSVIICPGYLRQNWLREVQLWLGDSYPVMVIDSAGKGKREEALHNLLYSPTLKIISYDMAANLLLSVKDNVKKKTKFFESVICDESHYLKEAKTKRFKSLRYSIRNAENIFLLTGTPAPNRPKDLFTQFSLIRPKIFNDYYLFARRYCGAYVDNFGKFIDRGQTNEKELACIFRKLVIRIRREDVLEEIPSVSRLQKVLSCKPSKVFIGLKRKFESELKNIDTSSSASFKVQSLASEMFLKTCEIKVKPVLDFLGDYIKKMSASEEKTIIFCKHQKMLQAIVDLFSKENCTFISISGMTPTKDRVSLVDRFLKSDDCNFAILTIGSCSTGLNMIPVSKMIFTELTWSPSDLSQCEARISRIGGSPFLEYTYLLCDNTLDEMVFRKLTRKTDMMNDIVDAGNDYGDFRFDKKRKTN